MIQFTSISQATNGSWTYVWATTGADYYRVILNGEVLNSHLEETTYTTEMPGYEEYPPPIEVVEEDELAETERWPAWLVLEWYASEDASEYLVQEKVSASWVTRSRIVSSALWVYTVLTPRLADDTEFEWRVVALNEIGDQSSPLAFKARVVRPPDTPTPSDIDVDFDDGDTEIVVSAI